MAGSISAERYFSNRPTSTARPGVIFGTSRVASTFSERARVQRLGKLEVAEAVALIIPVLEALEAAHQKGVVHCDIKPENLEAT